MPNNPSRVLKQSYECFILVLECLAIYRFLHLKIYSSRNTNKMCKWFYLKLTYSFYEARKSHYKQGRVAFKGDIN